MVETIATEIDPLDAGVDPVAGVGEEAGEGGRVFDRDHFNAMTASDRALQIELIGLFRAQAVLWRRLLIPDAPVHTWRDVAHSVKGAARGFGLWALAEACETAEALGRAGAVEGRWVSDQLERVRGRLEEALALLIDEERRLHHRAA
jgi:HPt (histidine-containing phosphotransfer) domain-containing protein